MRCATYAILMLTVLCSQTSIPPRQSQWQFALHAEELRALSAAISWSSRMQAVGVASFQTRFKFAAFPLQVHLSDQLGF